MLGLEYGKVALAPHTPDWARAFAAERNPLAAVLASFACRIEHVGSTAVPGLAAKPIVDLAVGVYDAGALATVLAAIDDRTEWLYRGDAGGDGGHVFVRLQGGRPRFRTHHLHVVAKTDPQWANYLLFRDFLTQSATARAYYGREKRALAARFPSSRRAYTAGKQAVAQALLGAARAARGGNGERGDWVE